MTAKRSRVKPGTMLLLVLAALVAASAGLYYLKYWFSYNADLKSRPWAYSTSPDAKLLVGKWQGSFTDPGGVAKQMEVEIYEPVTREEREKKAAHRTRRRKGLGTHGDQLAFQGRAEITSNSGVEYYAINGAVAETDHHQLGFDFIAADEKMRLFPNYTARVARPGNWQGDALTLTLGFIQYNADGSSSSTSEGVVIDGRIEWRDAEAEQKTVVLLRRKSG